VVTFEHSALHRDLGTYYKLLFWVEFSLEQLKAHNKHKLGPQLCPESNEHKKIK